MSLDIQSLIILSLILWMVFVSCLGNWVITGGSCSMMWKFERVSIPFSFIFNLIHLLFHIGPYKSSSSSPGSSHPSSIRQCYWELGKLLGTSSSESSGDSSRGVNGDNDTLSKRSWMSSMTILRERSQRLDSGLLNEELAHHLFIAVPWGKSVQD